MGVSFSDPFRKIIGGIHRIAFLDAGGTVKCAFDTSSGCYTSVEWERGTELFTAEFREDAATYAESCEMTDGIGKVRHSLEIGIYSPSAENSGFIRRITGQNGAGWIVFMVLNDGQVLFAGYSEPYGTERPLRLTASAVYTGSTRGNDSKYTLTLESFDSTPATFFNGTLPYDE